MVENQTNEAADASSFVVVVRLRASFSSSSAPSFANLRTPEQRTRAPALALTLFEQLEPKSSGDRGSKRGVIGSSCRSCRSVDDLRSCLSVPRARRVAPFSAKAAWTLHCRLQPPSAPPRLAGGSSCSRSRSPWRRRFCLASASFSEQATEAKEEEASLPLLARSCQASFRIRFGSRGMTTTDREGGRRACLAGPEGCGMMLLRLMAPSSPTTKMVRSRPTSSSTPTSTLGGEC